MDELVAIPDDLFDQCLHSAGWRQYGDRELVFRYYHSPNMGKELTSICRNEIVIMRQIILENT